MPEIRPTIFLVAILVVGLGVLAPQRRAHAAVPPAVYPGTSVPHDLQNAIGNFGGDYTEPPLSREIVSPAFQAFTLLDSQHVESAEGRIETLASFFRSRAVKSTPEELRALTDALAQSDLSSPELRVREVGAALARLDNLARLDKSPRQALEGNWTSGIEIFDYVRDDKSPLGLRILGIGVQQRRVIYEAAPWPLDSDAHDRYSQGILLLLWIWEPDAALRTDFLMPRIEKSSNKWENLEKDPQFWIKKFKPLMRIFADGPRRIRQMEVDRLKPPTPAPELNHLYRPRTASNERLRHLYGELASSGDRAMETYDRLFFDLSGPGFEAFRTLLSVRLATPKFRQQVLLERLHNINQTKLSAAEAAAFAALLRELGLADAPARIRELETLELTPQNTPARRPFVAVDATGVPILDFLVDSESPLGLKILGKDADQRRELYRQAPLPIGGEMSDSWSRGTYMLLWMLEPDLTLRSEFLLPRIERTAIASNEFNAGSDFWTKLFDPMLEIYDESHRAVRRAEIETLRPPR